MIIKFIASVLFLASTVLTAQTTFVPDDNFEQRLIDLGYDNVLDDTVLTANISGVQWLDVQYRSIADLTGLEDFESLVDFNCDGNSVTSIPLHPNVNLSFLACQNNQLTTLNLSQHTNLGELACTSNDLILLDLSQNTNLRYLVAGGNQFAELDLSNNSELLEVLVYGQNTALETVDVRSGNNTNILDFVITNSPNLPYIYVDDCNYSTINWTDIDPNTIFVEMEGQTSCIPLSTNEFNIDSDFSIHPNPSKGTFKIDTNQHIKEIEIIDLSGKVVAKYGNNDFFLTSGIIAGLYLVRIHTENGIVIRKIALQ